MTEPQSQFEAESDGGTKRAGNTGAFFVVAAGLLVSVAAWHLLGNGGSMPFGGVAVSEDGLSRVDSGDMAGAMTTMAGSPGFLGQFQGESKNCPTPLAWVALARVPGKAGGMVRIHSGSYLSPTFELTDVPQRLAIPYPAPYEQGRGEITVNGIADGLIVSLAPAWNVDHLNGAATRVVSWSVRPTCQG